MASSTVYIGSTSDPLFSFDDNSLTSISLENSLSIIGDELKIDTFEFDVRYTGEGSIEAVDYGTPVYFYRDGAMMGKFYFIRATRLSQYNHKVYCESIIGLLDRDTFYGGIYSNTSFRNVVESIISSNGLQRYYLYKKASVPSSQSSVLLSVDGYGEATMSCRMEVGVSVVPRGKYNTGYIAGALAPGDSVTDYDWNQSYRVSFSVFDSASDPRFRVALDYGRYSQTTISIPIDLANRNTNQFVAITADPVNAVLSAEYNGTTYTATISTSEANPDHIAPLYVFDGKFRFSTKDSSTGKYTSQSSVSSGGTFNYHYYRVYSPDDTLLIDAEVVREVETGLLYARNKITGYKGLLEGSTVQDADINYSSEDPDVIRSSYDLETVIEGTQFINGAGELVLNGWIPILSKRQALQQVLFATGASLLKGGNGEMVFTIVTDQTAEAIPDSAVYIDGEVEYPSMTNTIDVTEFSYETIEADAVEIFNNQDAAAVPDIYIAVFNSQPVFSNISAEGLTILAANANAAVVTGQGRILGHPYVRNETVISAVLGDRPDGKTVAITDVGLVNFGNSAAIVDRLKRYYRDAHTARPHIALTSQKCGTKYSFTNAFREVDSGFLTKISCVMSAKIKAACELVCGFSPSGSGSEYSNFVLLTGSGTWTVPEEVFAQDTPKIKVVLIGGGKGGYSGKAGDDGAHIRTSDANWKTMVKAEGGDPGEPGTGGRVYVVTITNPAASYTYACGAGGAGGQPSGQSTIEGSAGGATTLSDGSTTRSSASGTVRAQGIANEITGRVYAKPGASWTGRSGGKGGAGGYYTIEDGVVTQIAAEAVHNELTGYTSAAGSKGTDVISGGSIVSLGGCGGGAAGGYQSARPLYNNQFEGFDGYNAKAASGSELARGGEGGHGGNGVRYTPPTPEDYGSGGMGGVGGGGGGAAGGTNPDMASQFTLSVSGGTGGSGGPGGSGADGCIIIYY